MFKTLAMMLVLVWVLASGVIFTTVFAGDDGGEKPRMARQDVKWASAQAGESAYGGHCIVYFPPGYEQKSNWPVIVFFHGAGGKGRELAGLNREYIPKMLDDGRVLEAVVICPQARDYWNDDEAVAAFDFAMRYVGDRADAKRVYVTGLSSGGGAAWAVGIARADMLAALAPMCPFKVNQQGIESLKDVPICSYHNAHDPYAKVENSRAMIEVVKKAGNTRVRYTEIAEPVGKQITDRDGRKIYPKAHENAWITAYGDNAFWQWMFAQHR